MPRQTKAEAQAAALREKLGIITPDELFKLLSITPGHGRNRMSDGSLPPHYKVGREKFFKLANRAFLSPSVDGSVLQGAPSFTSSGSAISDVDTDLRRLTSLVRADRPGVTFVMASVTATYLATLRGSGGGAAYGDTLDREAGDCSICPC
jgi:hypothetical protein